MDWHTLYPLQSRYKTIQGLRYHYIDEGTGEPIIMIHGNPTWSFYFRNLIRGLSPDYRAIAPDHIGCGLSDKPSSKEYAYTLGTRIRDLESFISGFQFDRKLTLVLHDWGGAIGMGFAVNHPEMISRIVIMNTAAFPPPHGKNLPLRLSIIRNCPALARFLILRFNLFARSALILATQKPLSHTVKKGLIAPYGSPANRIATLKFVQDIPISIHDPAWEYIDRMDRHLNDLLHIPMMIAWGLMDAVFDVDYLLEWKRRFPHAETHLFENAGHYLLEDTGDAVLSKIFNFLKRNPG
ncbi:MAG: alpha/beta fold hydrolase [Desulfatirhabdiaceae bacterium]